MQTKFDALVHADIQGRPVWQCSIAAEEAALTKALALQAFGLAAGHVSSGKAELHQMSCMRWSSQGTREVAMISFESVAAFLESEKGAGHGAQPLNCLISCGVAALWVCGRL